MIYAFRAPESLSATKELPKRLLMARWGRNESVKGPVIVNETTARVLPRLQALSGFDEIALDFSHNTVEGSPAFKAEKEPRKVAAFGAPEVIPGEGLFFNISRWTPEGADGVKNGHFPDVSPALKFRDDADSGEVIFCHSCAVCRQGAITDLHTFAAEDPEKLTAAIATFSAETGTKLAMPYKELLCLILGLDPKTATEDAISNGAKAFATTIADIKAFAASFGDIKTFVASDPARSVQAFGAQLKNASEQIATLQKRLDDGERANLTALAIRDGKIIPLSAGELNLDQFRKIVAELPSDQVPLDKRTPEGVRTFSASSGVTREGEDVAEKMRRAAGIKKEDWDKHAKS